jgi:predicted transcriptional regulator of viral defense system
MTLSQDRQRLLDFARTNPIFKAGEVEAAGIHSQWLSRLVEDGALERVARGCYRLAATEATEHHTLAIIATVAPSAVVCLLSALQFHQIGTQGPPEVWIALKRGTAKPRLVYPPIHPVFFSAEPFMAGIEHHTIEGRSVRIYSIAKTIADCFKARNKIGLDVALEALFDAWRQHRLSLAELNHYARINRIQHVIQPYVEALVQ